MNIHVDIPETPTYKFDSLMEGFVDSYSQIPAMPPSYPIA